MEGLGFNPRLCGERLATAWDMAWLKIIIRTSCTSNVRGEVSGQLHILVALSPDKETPGSHLREGCVGTHPIWALKRKENSQVPARNWTPVCVLVTALTEPSWCTQPRVSYVDKQKQLLQPPNYTVIFNMSSAKGFSISLAVVEVTTQKTWKETVLHNLFSG
jgi:hypothetical protein